jgi:hypothetical protein
MRKLLLVKAHEHSRWCNYDQPTLNQSPYLSIQSADPDVVTRFAITPGSIRVSSGKHQYQLECTLEDYQGLMAALADLTKQWREIRETTLVNDADEPAEKVLENIVKSTQADISVMKCF